VERWTARRESTLWWHLILRLGIDTADLAQLCPTITSFAAGSPQPQLLWPYARDRFNLNYGARWAYVGILAGSVVLSWVASALALRFVDHSKR